MNEVATTKENTLPAISAESQAMITMIERIALDPNADIEKLEKMLEMKERIFNKNAEIQFNSAMVHMQSELPAIKKTGQIKVKEEVRSTYAKFEDILEVVKPIMKENGFAVTFKVETGSNIVKVTGILMHSGGHREDTTMELPVDMSGSKNSVQGLGSSVSYGKRYVLCALLNIATDDDDDGQGMNLITTDQVMEIAKKLNGNKAIEKKILDYAAVEAIHLIPASMYEPIIKRLENTKAVKDGA